MQEYTLLQREAGQRACGSIIVVVVRSMRYIISIARSLNRDRWLEKPFFTNSKIEIIRATRVVRFPE